MTSLDAKLHIMYKIALWRNAGLHASLTPRR